MIAIIPARGNSKRLPRKNLLPIGGVPMVVRAIRCAKEAGIFEYIVVSTEDWEIYDLAKAEGARSVARHSLLSDDEVQTAAVVFDALGACWYPDSFCVLNPSSPLRTAHQLKVLYKFFENSADCLMTVTEDEKHEGTALFCQTLPFLRTLDFYKLDTIRVIVRDSVDVNTQEDYERAITLSRS